MKLPDGVVDVRKLKSMAASESGPGHLTWVIAYNDRIAVGSRRHEAIRRFADTLKPPRGMEQSVMLLPVLAREPAETPAKAPVKTPVKAQAKARVKPRPKARAKTPVKARPKARAKASARSAPSRRAGSSRAARH